VGSSETHITGQGFNAVKFDPGKPARTIRRNDGNLGMHGACIGRAPAFSLPEFKRFGSFPMDSSSQRIEEGIRQIGDCVPHFSCGQSLATSGFVVLPAAQREDAAA